MAIESQAMVWRISNGLLGATHLATFGAFLFRTRIARPNRSQLLLGATAVSVISAHFLVAMGFMVAWAPLIFIVGLLQQIFIAIHNFVILLFPLRTG